MRRLVAIGLIVCLGALVPAAAAPLRLCLSHSTLTIPGLGTVGAEEHDADCCGEEDGAEENSCCRPVEKLPEAISPEAPDAIPPAMVLDLPPAMMPPFATEPVRVSVARVHPIRGPTALGRRAMLKIWRL